MSDQTNETTFSALLSQERRARTRQGVQIGLIVLGVILCPLVHRVSQRPAHGRGTAGHRGAHGRNGAAGFHPVGVLDPSVDRYLGNVGGRDRAGGGALAATRLSGSTQYRTQCCGSEGMQADSERPARRAGTDHGHRICCRRRLRDAARRAGVRTALGRHGRQVLRRSDRARARGPARSLPGPPGPPRSRSSVMRSCHRCYRNLPT